METWLAQTTPVPSVWLSYRTECYANWIERGEENTDGPNHCKRIETSETKCTTQKSTLTQTTGDKRIFDLLENAFVFGFLFSPQLIFTYRAVIFGCLQIGSFQIIIAVGLRPSQPTFCSYSLKSFFMCRIHPLTISSNCSLLHFSIDSTIGWTGTFSLSSSSAIFSWPGALYALNRLNSASVSDRFLMSKIA